VPRIEVPAPYRGPTAGRPEIEARGATVRACLEDGGRQFPGFAEQVFDAEGRVHRFVTLFVNGDEIARDAVDMPVAESDTIEILAAVAGG